MRYHPKSHQIVLIGTYYCCFYSLRKSSLIVNDMVGR